MKTRSLFYIGLKIVAILLTILQVSNAWSAPREDTRSLTLLSNAWEALDTNKLDDVMRYAGKCIELYEAMAIRQQAKLSDYVQGSKEDVMFYWQLNDVATAYFIQAEACRKAGLIEEAVDNYEKIIRHFKYSQCLMKDGAGGFWRPAEKSLERVIQLAKDEDID